jgi:hypothetical protein
VNALCAGKGIKEKGVSKTEFALFFTTLSNYTKIEETAKEILPFRNDYKKVTTTETIEKFGGNIFTLIILNMILGAMPLIIRIM